MENGKRKQNQAEVQNGGVTPPDDRTLRKQLMQLSGSYQASDKGDHPHLHRQDSSDIGKERVIDGGVSHAQQCKDSHQGRGQPSYSIQQCHHLRHLDHFYPDGQCTSDNNPYHHVEIDVPYRGNSVVDQRNGYPRK